MRRKLLLPIAAAVVLFAALVYYYALGGHVPAGQSPLENLTAQNLSAVQGSFNNAKDGVRVMLLLSPT